MSGTTSTGDDDVPVYLMPVAAVCGMYALVNGLSILYTIYRNLTYKAATATAAQKLNAPTPIASRPFAIKLTSVIVAVLIYAYVVARVEEASIGVFDPFEILNVATNADTSEIKKAYRSLSLQHHPDKGGDAAVFNQISLAYKALSDATSRENWEKYGHPDGPQSQTLAFALPDWLLHPEGATAVVLVVLYIGMFISLIMYVIRFATKTEKAAADAAFSMSVAGSDIEYIQEKLKSDSTHEEILYIIATTPENVANTQKGLQLIESMKKERIATEQHEAMMAEKADSKKSETDALLNDSGGWADEDEDGESAEAAKKHEEAQKARDKLMKEAAGKKDKNKVVFEGMDEGAIGQEWVEKILTENKVWPPKFGRFASGEKGMEIPAVRRNFAWLVGRLNASQTLNSHPDLAKSASLGLLDTTYFQGSMRFRQACGLLLEGCIRVAVQRKDTQLTSRIIETVTMFKLGVPSLDKETTDWFVGVMKKTHGGEDGIPRVTISDKKIETAGEDEIATEDTSTLTVMMEREHAQNIMQQQVALAQKQGIDPRIMLQAYREGWWIVVSAKKEGESDSQFITCAPMVISNAAQKGINAVIKFRAPSEPGKYIFNVEIKSQEFLGADQSFELEVDIVDKETVQMREMKDDDEEEEGDEGEDGETKKEK